MPAEPAQTTSQQNGQLWGASAADWANLQEPTARPVYLATFNSISLQPGARYLDAGCGAGLALQIAAERGAHVTGLDAAENLLAIARTRVPSADLHTGELESLPFADHTFDLVTGFNSFQYAANPTRALSEARRVAVPGSPIVIMTWGRPEGMQAATLVAALRPLLPPPPPNAPGPFALSDETALRSFAQSAGLTPHQIFDVPCPWRYPDLPTALRALRSSGIAVKAIANSSTEAVDNAHTQALAPFRQPDGDYLIQATFRVLITHA